MNIVLIKGAEAAGSKVCWDGGTGTAGGVGQTAGKDKWDGGRQQGARCRRAGVRPLGPLTIVCLSTAAFTAAVVGETKTIFQ